MIEGIIAFLAIVVIAIIVKSGWRPSRLNIPNIHWGWVGAVLGILLVIFLFRGCNSHKPTPPPSPQTTAPTTIVVKKVVQRPTLYKFSDYADNCVSLKIEVYDFYWYPKGGRVTVFPPKGEPFVDTPGVDVKTHYEPGVWRWCAKDPGTIGVEVWQ
jgi:hypothetical protein